MLLTSDCCCALADAQYYKCFTIIIWRARSACHSLQLLNSGWLCSVPDTKRSSSKDANFLFYLGISGVLTSKIPIPKILCQSVCLSVCLWLIVSPYPPEKKTRPFDPRFGPAKNSWHKKNQKSKIKKKRLPLNLAIMWPPFFIFCNLTLAMVIGRGWIFFWSRSILNCRRAIIFFDAIFCLFLCRCRLCWLVDSFFSSFHHAICHASCIASLACWDAMHRMHAGRSQHPMTQ